MAKVIELAKKRHQRDAFESELQVYFSDREEFDLPASSWQNFQEQIDRPVPKRWYRIGFLAASASILAILLTAHLTLEVVNNQQFYVLSNGKEVPVLAPSDRRYNVIFNPTLDAARQQQIARDYRFTIKGVGIGGSLEVEFLQKPSEPVIQSLRHSSEVIFLEPLTLRPVSE